MGRMCVLNSLEWEGELSRLGEIGGRATEEVLSYSREGPRKEEIEKSWRTSGRLWFGEDPSKKLPVTSNVGFVFGWYDPRGGNREIHIAFFLVRFLSLSIPLEGRSTANRPINTHFYYLMYLCLIQL